MQRSKSTPSMPNYQKRPSLTETPSLIPSQPFSPSISMQKFENVALKVLQSRPHRVLSQGMYIGLEIDWDTPSFDISWNDGYFELDNHHQTIKTDKKGEELIRLVENEILDKLFGEIIQENYKILACGISFRRPTSNLITLDKKMYTFELSSRLWFELDILPVNLYVRGDNPSDKSSSAGRKLITLMTPSSAIGGIPRITLGKNHQVEVDLGFKSHLWNIQQDQGLYSPSLWQMILEWRDKCLDERISFFNSTPVGGGVALMRHSTMRLLNKLNISSKWFVMKPSPVVFNITKTRFHNVLQGVSKDGETLTRKDTEEYEKWSRFNALHYFVDSVFPTSTICIFDDPQVLGLIPYLKLINPKCKVIFRCHIEIISKEIIKEYPLNMQSFVEGSDKDGLPRLNTFLPQDASNEIEKVWTYLHVNYIHLADLIIFHPVESFIPRMIPKEKVLVQAPTTDALDGLNKHLAPLQSSYYFSLFNRISYDQCRKRVDFYNRPYIIQVSRFDPSKGLDKCIQVYQELRRRMIDFQMIHVPQLVLVGHGSIDDPDGIVIFKQLKKMLQHDTYSKIENDVIMVRLPPSDTLLNSVLQGAKIGLQLSSSEGFEIKVTEGLHKGIPMIISNVGGLSHQVINGRNGFIIDNSLKRQEFVKEVVDKLELLLRNNVLRREMGQYAKENVSEEFFTGTNVLHWLILSSHLTTGVLEKEIVEILAQKQDEDLKKIVWKEVETVQDWLERRKTMAGNVVWSKELWQKIELD